MGDLFCHGCGRRDEERTQMQENGSFNDKIKQR